MKRIGTVFLSVFCGQSCFTGTSEPMQTCVCVSIVRQWEKNRKRKRERDKAKDFPLEFAHNTGNPINRTLCILIFFSVLCIFYLDIGSFVVATFYYSAATKRRKYDFCYPFDQKKGIKATRPCHEKENAIQIRIITWILVSNRTTVKKC